MFGTSAVANQGDQDELQKAGKNLKDKGGDPLPQGIFAIASDEQRGCTDIFFLLFYILFWGLMIFIGIIGFVNGDPRRLTAGYDFNGNICGYDSMSGKPYIYYPNPFPNSTIDFPDLSWAVCVNTCPYVTRTPPDICLSTFRVVTEDHSPFFPSKTIVCGGLSNGATDMAQFDYPPDRLLYEGYAKYCMGRVPVCLCSLPQVTRFNVTIGTALIACCDGVQPQANVPLPRSPATTPAAADPNATTPTPAATTTTTPPGNGSTPAPAAAADSGVPWTVASTLPVTKVVGITIGRQFGQCFYSYPSIPVSRSVNRCVPVPTGAKTASGAAVNASAVFLSSVGANGSSASGSIDAAIASVLGASAGPQQTFSLLVAEVVENKWVILGSAGMALLVAFVYTQLLRFFVKPMTWTFLVLLWLVLLAAFIIVAVKARFIQPDQIPVVGGQVDALQMPFQVDTSQTNRSLVSIAAALIGFIFLAYTIFLIVFIPRIAMAIDVIETAGQCFQAMPLAMLFPVIQWVAMCGLFAWCIAVFIYLTASGTWNQESHSFKWDENTRRSAIFNFFGLLWGRAMILATGNLIISGATAQWYLADDKGDLKSPLLCSTRRSLRYHLGTAAFGSFIIAVVQFIRWVFRYYMYQLKKLDQENRIVKYLAVIGECCLSCLERFLNFINKNAYIQTSITGTSFCMSAINAFGLLLRNFLRLGALTVVSSVYLQVGKLFIAVLTTFICALIIVGGDVNNVFSAPIFSTTIIALLAFGVGCAFMDLWDMIIETLFQCFCMDSELSGGNPPDRSTIRSLIDKHPPSVKAVAAMSSCVRPAPGDPGYPSAPSAPAYNTALAYDAAPHAGPAAEAGLSDDVNLAERAQYPTFAPH